MKGGWVAVVRIGAGISTSGLSVAPEGQRKAAAAESMPPGLTSAYPYRCRRISVAAAGVEHADRPEPGMRDNHLRVVGCDEMDGPCSDGLHLGTGAIDFDPVAERECQRQPDGRSESET